MSKKILDRNNFTGETTYHHYDHATGKTWIETVQDTKVINNILDANKSVANSGYNNTKGDFFHFATIPNSVIIKLKDEKGIDINNKDDLKKLEILIQRDPEWKYLRRY